MKAIYRTFIYDQIQDIKRNFKIQSFEVFHNILISNYSPATYNKFDQQACTFEKNYINLKLNESQNNELELHIYNSKFIIYAALFLNILDEVFSNLIISFKKEDIKSIIKDQCNHIENINYKINLILKDQHLLLDESTEKLPYYAKSGKSGHPIPEQTGQVCRMKVVI